MEFLKNPLPILFLVVAFACQEEPEVTGDPLKSMKVMLAGPEGKTKDWKLVTAERFKYNGSEVVEHDLAQCDYDNVFRFTNINWSSVNTVSYLELRGDQSCTESEAEIMESGAWELSKDTSGEITIDMRNEDLSPTSNLLLFTEFGAQRSVVHSLTENTLQLEVKISFYADGKEISYSNTFSFESVD